jgi:hypothetical protein
VKPFTTEALRKAKIKQSKDQAKQRSSKTKIKQNKAINGFLWYLVPPW